MNNATRNVMILYATVALLSIAGVALNIIPIFNINSIADAKMPKQIGKALITGFYIMSVYYLIIALAALGAIFKKKYSKALLVLLIILLLVAFVFRPVIFDYIVGEIPQ